MAGITITEALAEIKTLGKRIDKKRAFINNYLARVEGAKDPLANQGGSENAIIAERQGIGDLEQRLIDLRRAIQHANDSTLIDIGSASRSISEWLTWRRDIAPSQRAWLKHMQDGLNNLREKAKRDGNAVFSAVAIAGDAKANDIVVNIDELALAHEIETLENTLGQLDGQLSLKNATVTVTL